MAQRVLLKLLSRIENWFYEKDITKRRVKHAPKPYVIITVSGLLLCLGVILWFAFSLAIARIIVQDFLWLGAQLGLSSDFATIIVAEVIAFVVGTVITIVMARTFAPEPKVVAPKITSCPQPPRTGKDGVKSYAVHVSNEEGETAALACQARVILEDIVKRDVLDLPNTRFTSSSFTQTMKIDLLWDDGKKQRTLRSGDDTEIEVFRLIPASSGVEAHLEVPSCDGSWKSTVCLRLKTTFYPKVRIVPLNGKHATEEFVLHFNTSLKDWLLEFGP